MAESLLSMVKGLQRQVEALRGLEKEVKELRQENMELRSLLGPSGAQAKNVSLTLRREMESGWSVVGRGEENGNRGTIAKVSGGNKTGQTLAVKNSFTVLKDQYTGEAVKKRRDHPVLRYKR